MSEADSIKETIRQRADAAAGLRQMTRLIGMQSTKATCDYEADILEQEAKDIREETFGEGAKPMGEPEESEDEPMRDILATGPVTIHNGNNEVKEEPEKEEPPQAPQPRPNPPSKIASLGLAALGLGAAISLPILAWNLSKSWTPQERPEINVGARFVPVPNPNMSKP